jgi:hypothetical protein
MTIPSHNLHWGGEGRLNPAALLEIEPTEEGTPTFSPPEGPSSQSPREGLEHNLGFLGGEGVEMVEEDMLEDFM